MDNHTRIAWLSPSIERGAYWQPVLQEFTKLFNQTVFYTSKTWPGFDPTVPGASVIKKVGKVRFQETKKVESGYNRGLILVYPTIIVPLLKFKPHVVFASGFSLWTLLVILFKPVGKWRLIIFYDGSSPNIDFRDDKFRSRMRKWMSRHVDRFISNSIGGKDYLMEALKVPEYKVVARPYQVPDAKTLLQNQSEIETTNELDRPIFLCVGLIVLRKGIKNLLQACTILKSQGYEKYTLVLVGDGDQRPELERFIQEEGLSEQVIWTGWMEYGQLGAYFRETDVFVFPTLEDIWGVVLLEAMAFGKPVLCSKWAGSSEMVVEGENGYIFDPYEPENLAGVMGRFIDEPETIAQMGQRSRELIAKHNPDSAAQFLAEMAQKVLTNKQ